MAGLRVGITYIRPCVTEAGKISAETHLAPSSEESADSTLEFFDSSKLCWALNSSQIFNRVKCSEKLGIAKTEINGKTIVISKGGRINVRRAEDEKDALRTTRLVSRAAWPAMICSRCGKAVVECVAGLCARCRGKDCILLLVGPPDSTSTLARVPETRTVGEILTEFEASQYPVFNEVKANLDEAFQILRSVMAAPSSDTSFDSIEKSIRKKLEAGKLLAQKLIAQSQRQVSASAGLTFMGIAVNLESLSHTASQLARLVQSRSDSLLVEQAWRIAKDGYEALWQKDPVKVQELTKSYAQLKKRLGRIKGKRQKSDLRKSLEKVAELGLHFSRIISMRLAV